MKRWLGAVVAALALVVGCAHVEAPPGGPEDRTPPSLLAVQPEAEAVVERYDGPVVFQFDERISEQGVEDAVMVSPRTSPVVVRRGRSEIQVSLREGWQTGVIYHVTLEPRIRDLFNNPLSAPIRLVFSTGPEIPETRVSGTVLDRITGRPAADIRMEAIRSPDSLVYSATTDAQGAFMIEQLPEGSYRFRAFQDMNSDRALTSYEPRDTAAGAISDAEPIELTLRILQPDSTAAVVQSVRFQGGTLEVEFDDFLDPDQPIQPDQVTVSGPTGVALGVSRIALGTLIPLDTAAVAPADTAAAAPADTAAAPQVAAAPDPPADPAPAADAATDPLPVQRITIELAPETPVEPGAEHLVQLRSIRNVNGLVGDADGSFEPPVPDAVP